MEFGDLLLLMTDGITEPRNADGVMYGEPRSLDEVLSNILTEMSTEELVDMLINDVMGYSGL